MPQAAAPAAPAAAAPTGGEKQFSLAEIARHSTKEDCWIAVKGVVYDATPYLEEHPGGASSILIAAGARRGGGRHGGRERGGSSHPRL